MIWRLPRVPLDSVQWHKFHMYLATENPDVVVGWSSDNPAPLLLGSFQQPADVVAGQFSVAMRQSTAMDMATAEGREYAPRLPDITFAPRGWP